MNSLSFNSLVDLYDVTRSFDEDCFNSALRFIETSFPVSSYPSVFEPGIGTGRIAIPLAKLGYQITGIDISEEMMSVLQKRLQQIKYKSPITIQNADVTQLPFINNIFNMTVVVHVFYFIPNWKKAADEILRVTHNDGAIILMHTGTGAEIPFLNDRYKELCTLSDSPIPKIGANSTQEVVDYFNSLGCSSESIRDKWQWTSKIKLRDALNYISLRSYSFTTFASDAVHKAVIDKLEAEPEIKFNSLDKIIEVPNQIYFVIVRKKIT